MTGEDSFIEVDYCQRAKHGQQRSRHDGRSDQSKAP